MFLEPKNNQIAEITHIFNQLNPDFQNFIITQLKNLLKMNQNYQGDDEKIDNLSDKHPL
jgi:hypothetical protein